MRLSSSWSASAHEPGEARAAAARQADMETWARAAARRASAATRHTGFHGFGCDCAHVGVRAPDTPHPDFLRDYLSSIYQPTKENRRAMKRLYWDCVTRPRPVACLPPARPRSRRPVCDHDYAGVAWHLPLGLSGGGADFQCASRKGPAPPTRQKIHWAAPRRSSNEPGPDAPVSPRFKAPGAYHSRRGSYSRYSRLPAPW